MRIIRIIKNYFFNTNKLKNNTLVRFDYDNLKEEFHKYYIDKFPENEDFIFLGEIKQMPDHCIVVNYRTGQIYSGYHTADFMPIPDEEL